MVHQTSVYLRTIIAEYVAMTLFIFIACGGVIGYLAPRQFDYKGQPLKEDYQVRVELTFGVMVPFIFGLTVMILAYATAPYKAGQLNPAVSIGLFFLQKQGFVQTIFMIVAQLLGSLTAVGLLTASVPNAADSGYGANALSPKVSTGNALLAEAVGTFALMIVVLQVCSSKYAELIAAPAIGFTVMVVHGILLPIDGCSINPARSFGPAVASGNWDHFWVFVVGPIIGALVAAAGHALLAEKEAEDSLPQKYEGDCKNCAEYRKDLDSVRTEPVVDKETLN